MNAFSQRAYHGFNIFFLNICAKSWYSYPLYGTFKQISEAGGRVKKGETSTPVVFWKVTNQENEQDEDGNEVLGESKRYFTPFYYNVFNLDQTEGIDIQKYVPNFTKSNNQPLEICERTITHMPNPPHICHDQAGAFYSPSHDKVNVPKISYFDTSEEYYSVSFHELAHSTGHSSRLNRFVDNKSIFAKNSYDYEELVAEMTATLLCSHCGIEQTVENSVAYLTGWAKFLKEERKTTLFGAATKAQAAVNYILNKSSEIEQPAQNNENQTITVF
jgi:antirestriction protein ArdC